MQIILFFTLFGILLISMIVIFKISGRKKHEIDFEEKVVEDQIKETPPPSERELIDEFVVQN